MNTAEVTGRHYSTQKPVRLKYANGKITEIAEIESAPEHAWLAPALFDMQVNGYGGVDFQGDNATADDLLRATEKLRDDGCAQIMLTLVTDEWSRLTQRLRRLALIRSQTAGLRKAIPGWHIEGPFLNPKPGFHGAHDPALMENPTPARMHELREITGTDPVVLTIAPERPGAIEAISVAVKLGMKVSLGHTDASAEILKQAVAAGATGFTHLGNGCAQQLDRHDNILWRVFNTPGLTAGLIPDALHVSQQFFNVICRQLDREHIYFTTDAVAPAGAPPGEYSVGRMRIHVGPDLIVRQPGKTNFAGSALRPIEGIRRAAEMLNRPWQQLWDHFSLIPRRFCGLDSNFEPGGDARFCVVNTSADGKIISARVID